VDKRDRAPAAPVAVEQFGPVGGVNARPPCTCLPCLRTGLSRPCAKASWRGEMLGHAIQAELPAADYTLANRDRLAHLPNQRRIMAGTSWSFSAMPRVALSMRRSVIGRRSQASPGC
jgi:hypothetical protein